MNQPPSLLLIDDEERVLRSLAMLFRGRYSLHATTDPQAALDYVGRERVHVVVSDQRMPQMRGAELLREVRLRSPNTMRILLTGYSELDAVVASVNEGEIFRFVQKPWDAAELRDTVQQAATISHALFSTSAQPSVTAISAPPPQREAVLVIDDDESVYRTVSDLVGEAHPVMWARSVDQALELLQVHPIGVLISELSVGGDSVTALLKVLKAQYPEVVAIVLTPFHDVSVFVGLINQGQVFRLLPKPVRRGTVSMSIVSAMKHHRSLRQTPERVIAHAVAPLNQVEEINLATRMMGLLGRLRRRAQAL